MFWSGAFVRVATPRGAVSSVFRRFAISVMLCLLAASSASAAEGVIDEAEWRTLTDGKTVRYKLNGRVTGREYYPPGEYFSIFEDATSGACFEGPWAFTEGRFCFLYADNFQCFSHTWRGDEIVSTSDVSGKEQVIDQIQSGDHLRCQH